MNLLALLRRGTFERSLLVRDSLPASSGVPDNIDAVRSRCFFLAALLCKEREIQEGHTPLFRYGLFAAANEEQYEVLLALS